MPRPWPGRFRPSGRLVATCAVTLAVLGSRQWSSRTVGGTALDKLLPDDLNTLESSAVIGAVGVQLLLFGGFVPDAAGGWRRDVRPPTTLADRLERIAPTWKGGRVDYSWDAPAAGGGALSLFGASRARATAVHGAGATVRSLGGALEAAGLRASDFDETAQRAVREMLRWRLPASGAPTAAPDGPVRLLVFSFDATPGCRSVADCATPGPANELLAATALAFTARHAASGQAGEGSVEVFAQWEVSAAIAARGGRSLAVGTPGLFESTAQIFEAMLDASSTPATDGAGGCERRLLLLAHPDHLVRVTRTARTLLAARTPAGACAPTLLTALDPYTLGWPLEDEAGAEGVGRGRNLFRGVSATVRTVGEARHATWYDGALGYYPDGESQRWVHRREVWVLYDHWARCKGLVTGVISAEGP